MPISAISAFRRNHSFRYFVSFRFDISFRVLEVTASIAIQYNGHDYIISVRDYATIFAQKHFTDTY
jgi:hypothetical protein